MTKAREKILGWGGFILLVVYFGTYLVFRATHLEVWERDDKAYVIFPKNQVVLFYLFRPLTYLDAALTGMRFHIGPHETR